MTQPAAHLPLLGDDRDRINALDELFARSLAYRKNSGFQALLKFIVKFSTYSPFNCFLLHMQNPDVSFVATAEHWHQRFGRWVKPDARALVILAPMTPVLFVYDLADTEGDALPEPLRDPFETKGPLSETIWNRTMNNCAVDAISVASDKMAPLKAGQVRITSTPPVWADDGQLVVPRYAIRLNSDLHLAARYATLIHELGHIYCGHVGGHHDAWWRARRALSEEQVEFEAESVSHLVCVRRGLTTKSDQYLAQYLEAHERVPEISLNAVLRAAGHIETMGERALPKKKKQATQSMRN